MEQSIFGEIIVRKETRDTMFEMWDLNVQLNILEIYDDFIMSEDFRDTDFLNIAEGKLSYEYNDMFNYDEANIIGTSLIRGYMFSLDNVGIVYERRIMTADDYLGLLGGLLEALLSSCLVVDLIFGAPFRILDRAVSFRTLQRN